MSQKSATFMAFWGQNFAKFRTPNFAKLILQAQISLSRNSRKFCNTNKNSFSNLLRKVQALVFGIIQGNWEKHNKYIIHIPSSYTTFGVSNSCKKLHRITTYHSHFSPFFSFLERGKLLLFFRITVIFLNKNLIFTTNTKFLSP